VDCEWTRSDAVTTRTLSEAIYRLGRISTVKSLTNVTLMRTLADLTGETLQADVVAVAVFDRGIEQAAASCCVRGPWSEDLRDRFLEQSTWTFDERATAQRLAGLRRGRLYHRPDLMAEPADARARGYSDPTRALPLGDQASGLYRRSDGLEFLLSIHKVGTQGGNAGPFTRAQLARAGALAPFVAQCWATSWRLEPAWMGTLKPQSRVILEQLLEGFDDDQIASRTGLSYHSVRAHLKRLFREAGVRSRLHLMQACRAASGGPELTVEIPPEEQVREAIG
jgi:DNA-binding CsgD family transcriptional regulator